VDVGISTDEDSSAVVLFAQLVVSFAWVGHTRFSKPAKHVFLQLVCGHKLSRIQKSCISSVQLKRRASLSAYTLRMAFQNALLHTRVVSSILASLILCFIIFWLQALTWSWLDTWIYWRLWASWFVVMMPLLVPNSHSLMCSHYRYLCTTFFSVRMIAAFCIWLWW